jgi:hypothetical protein
MNDTFRAAHRDSLRLKTEILFHLRRSFHENKFHLHFVLWFVHPLTHYYLVHSFASLLDRLPTKSLELQIIRYLSGSLSLSHLFTHSLTHYYLVHSFASLLDRSLNQSLVHQIIRYLSGTLPRSFIHSASPLHHSLTHSLTHVPIYSRVHRITYPLFHSRLTLHSFPHSPIHPHIRSLNH